MAWILPWRGFLEGQGKFREKAGRDLARDGREAASFFGKETVVACAATAADSVCPLRRVVGFGVMPVLKLGVDCAARICVFRSETFRLFCVHSFLEGLPVSGSLICIPLLRFLFSLRMSLCRAYWAAPSVVSETKLNVLTLYDITCKLLKLCEKSIWCFA